MLYSMKSLIIYDSVFGNTEKISRAIGSALGSGAEVVKVGSSSIKPEGLAGMKLDLLIVGSPTRAFRPTKDLTAFLRKIPKNGLAGVRCAAFDTRMSLADVKSRVLTGMVMIFGYADKPIANMLRKKGAVFTDERHLEGFIVKGTEGPLADGELERAAVWAKELSEK